MRMRISDELVELDEVKLEIEREGVCLNESKCVCDHRFLASEFNGRLTEKVKRTSLEWNEKNTPNEYKPMYMRFDVYSE